MEKPLSVREITFVLLLFAFLSVTMTHPLIFRISDHIPGDLEDPLYNVWAMAWNLHTIRAESGSFWDANIFYPHKGTLLYADYLPALSLLGSPVVLLKGNHILAYNVLFLLSFFLSATGMYFLVRYLTGSTGAAIISGLIFAFFPFRFAHISHLELLYACWMPLGFLFLHRFFDKPTYLNLAAAGFFFVLQALSCAYYGVYFKLFAGLFILYFALRKGFWRRGSFWLKTGILAMFCFLALYPFFHPFIKVLREMSFERPLWEVKFYSAELQHFLAVPPWNLAWGWLTGRLGAQEWQLFPGFVPLFLAFFWWLKRSKQPDFELEKYKKRKILIWWDRISLLFISYIMAVGITGGFVLELGAVKISSRNIEKLLLLLGFWLVLRVILDKGLRNRWQRSLASLSQAQGFYLSTAVLAWLLSMGPVIRCLGREIISSPYLLLYKWIPGFQGTRAPSRLVVVMMLGLAVICGWAVALIVEKKCDKKRRALVCLILGSAVLFEFASLPLPLARVKVGKEIPEIYSSVKALPTEVVLIELPMPEPGLEWGKEAVAMYYSIFHWRRLVNGYSGYSPPAYQIVNEAMEFFPSGKTFDLLRDLEVQYILIHTERFRREKAREMITRLSEFPGEIELMTTAGGDHLYRLRLGARLEVGKKSLVPVIDRENWTAWSNRNQHKVHLAFDGDPSTGWSTGYPQMEGDFFLLDLGSFRNVGRIELRLDGDPLDYPRGFKLEGSEDGKRWKVLLENPAYFPRLSHAMVKDYSQYEVVMYFEPENVRFLRLTLIKSHRNRHWSIHEFICLRTP